MTEDYTIYTKTRKEALKLNLKFYFTGKLCKNGHMDRKYSRNGGCCSCSCLSSKKSEIINKEKRKIQRNSRKYKDKRNNRRKLRRLYDIEYKLGELLRGRVTRALRINKKQTSAIKD